MENSGNFAYNLKKTWYLAILDEYLWSEKTLLSNHSFFYCLLIHSQFVLANLEIHRKTCCLFSQNSERMNCTKKRRNHFPLFEKYGSWLLLGLTISYLEKWLVWCVKLMEIKEHRLFSSYLKFLETAVRFFLQRPTSLRETNKHQTSHSTPASH